MVTWLTGWAQHEGDASLSKCARAGLAVRPRKGDALMFYNLLETGRTDGYSVHQVLHMCCM